MKPVVQLSLITGLAVCAIAVYATATTQQPTRKKNPMLEKEFINPAGLASTPSYTQAVTVRGGALAFAQSERRKFIERVGGRKREGPADG